LRRAAVALVLAVAALGGLGAPAHARTVRAFAMGPKLDLSWLESRETFRAKAFALMDERERGPGTPPIKRGAGDAASHLLGPEDRARPVETARDLVVWPESLGLFAALTGERAQPARESGSLEGSIAALIAAYAPQSEYYAAKYPQTADRPPETRLLALALTDTFARTVVEPFAEMADRYDVYLHVGVDMAQDWQVVCTDKEAFDAADPSRLAGGVRCDEESPEKVQRLRDPFEPERDYAYEATSPAPSVMALVFDPDGRLISKQVKTYLTPVELGDREGELALDLVPGRVSDGLGVVRTPVGRLGFVTSKDAWMPDVTQKLDQRGVEILVQPEFFVGDLVRRGGMWSADTLIASGYNDVLRHPSLNALVLPEMTGGVFLFYADAQQHIAVKPRTGREPHGYLVGQPPARGLVRVSPWVVPDPIRPDEPFAERRERLGRAGEDLEPGSGVECPDPLVPGPCEDGHVEDVLFHDVRVGETPRRRPFGGRRLRTRFSPAAAVSPSRAPQRNVAVARRGRQVLLAFEERRGGRDQVFLVRSRDGGRTWSRRVRPTGRPRGATDEWWPAVALGPRGVATVAWTDRSSGRERVWFARSTDGGRRFGPPSALDPSPPPEVAQWRPALAQGPGDVVHAAFVDERWVQGDDGLPQAGLHHARIVAGAPEPSRRLDEGRPEPLATKLDNAWAPSVAARGERVLVTWVDFENYDWDVFARTSADGGETFGDQVQVNDTPDGDEALNDSPQAVLGPARGHVAWTDWRKRDITEREPHQAYDVYAGTPGALSNRRVDDRGDAQVSAFSPAACAVGDDLLVAWQDAARGVNEIRVTRMRDGDRRGRVLRVDDAGGTSGNAWRPRIACSGGAVLAAWEDERDGPAQVYAALGRARRVR
jgi:hypothetical protein